MKIAIVGSRGFDDYELLKEFISETVAENQDFFAEGIDTVVSGGAKGADTLGERYADEMGYQKLIFKADWDKYGKRAGFIRNVDIIDNCDVCFAFWDGQSHGTKHDIDLCIEKMKRCFVCHYKNYERETER